MSLDPVAAYGAVLATATAGWQIYSEVRLRRERLTIEGHVVVSVTSLTETQAFADDPWAARPSFSVALSVANVGAAATQVETVAIRQSSDDGGRVWTARHKWGLPWRLEAGERRTIQADREELEDLILGMPLIAYATSGRGRTFESLDFGTHDRMAISIPSSVLSDLNPDWKQRVYMHEVVDLDED